MIDEDDGLRELLQTLSPSARDDLRRALIRDQADRDAISSSLIRYRGQNGQDWADIIDIPDAVPRGAAATPIHLYSMTSRSRLVS